jgi:hypothetical protein
MQSKKLKLPRYNTFVVEIQDLVRYLNTVVFMYWIIKTHDDVALNRLATHPVENFFAMIRIACHENHSWERFLSACAKGTLCSEIIMAHGLKEHMRRDFSVAGTKTYNQNDKRDKFEIENFLWHGLKFCQILSGTFPTNAEEVATVWFENLKSLSIWNKDMPSFQMYCPGPNASDSALSRIIAFQPDGHFKWNHKKRVAALRLHIDPMLNDDVVASIVGCSVRNLADLVEKNHCSVQNVCAQEEFDE